MGYSDNEKFFNMPFQIMGKNVITENKRSYGELQSDRQLNTLKIRFAYNIYAPAVAKYIL